MQNKILVTYASRTGSTAEVAEAISKTLMEGGADMDVLPMQDIEDLSSYRAIILGNCRSIGIPCCYAQPLQPEYFRAATIGTGRRSGAGRRV